MIQHLACIMDGNRRWATAHGLQKNEGHTKGIETVKVVTEFCLRNSIEYLSLYTLSTENLARSEQEKNHIFSLMLNHFKEGSTLLRDCLDNGVRIRFVGDRSLFPTLVLPICDRVEKQTEHLSKLNLNFMFCYGGRQDIIHAVKKISKDLLAGKLSLDAVESISAESFKNYLWLGGIPDPDLIIRPGGVTRTSNFLMYESAYSEWYFTNRMWPEMTVQDFQEALDDFAQRQRRFGL